MLSLIPALVLAPATFTGTWKGTVTIHTPNGHEEHGEAVLWIGRRGGHLMGSMGESTEQQTTLTGVRTDGEGLLFNFYLGGKSPIAVRLDQKAGHLVGSGRAAVTLDFDLKPSPTTHTLYETVANLDAKLFDAYNRRDLPTIEKLFTKDLEFYHDRDGLTDYGRNMDSFKRLFAESTRYRRELDEGTLEVYPVKNFGAMEIGVHRFYATELGKPEQLTVTAKFAHIWRYEDGTWKISRVVSYDHR